MGGKEKEIGERNFSFSNKSLGRLTSSYMYNKRMQQEPLQNLNKYKNRILCHILKELLEGRFQI